MWCMVFIVLIKKIQKLPFLNGYTRQIYILKGPISNSSMVKLSFTVGLPYSRPQSMSCSPHHRRVRYKGTPFGLNMLKDKILVVEIEKANY